MTHTSSSDGQLTFVGQCAFDEYLRLVRAFFATGQAFKETLLVRRIPAGHRTSSGEAISERINFRTTLIDREYMRKHGWLSVQFDQPSRPGASMWRYSTDLSEEGEKLIVFAEPGADEPGALRGQDAFDKYALMVHVLNDIRDAELETALIHRLANRVPISERRSISRVPKTREDLAREACLTVQYDQPGNPRDSSWRFSTALSYEGEKLVFLRKQDAATSEPAPAPPMQREMKVIAIVLDPSQFGATQTFEVPDQCEVVSLVMSRQPGYDQPVPVLHVLADVHDPLKRELKVAVYETGKAIPVRQDATLKPLGSFEPVDHDRIDTAPVMYHAFVEIDSPV